MKKKKVDIFKKYSPQELVDSFVFRSTLTDKQKEDSFNALRELRKKSQAKMTEGQKMSMRLGGLKYQMEDAVKEKMYDPSTSFGSYLLKYAKTIGRKNKELANDLVIDETRFSQIVNGHILPNEKIVYRLEFHSDNTIPAKIWLDVLQRDIENKVDHDLEIRKAEYLNVVHRIDLSNTKIFVASKKADVVLRVKQIAEKIIAVKSNSTHYTVKDGGSWVVKDAKVTYKSNRANSKK